MVILSRTWDPRAWWRRVYRDARHGLPQAVLAPLAGIPLFVASLVSIALLPVGIGVFLAPEALLGVRGMARRQRRLARDWHDVQIAEPYRPRPAEDTRGLIGHLQRCRWLLTDPATWRDLRWLVVNVPVGLVLGLLPTALVVTGIQFVVTAPWIIPSSSRNFVFILLPLLFGLALLAAEARLGLGARIGRANALLSAALLAPSARALAARVDRLTESRAQVIDSSAAELRRIERDLHDGAQARLAALGMSIGLAEQLVHDRPDEAVQLLAEARATSDQALADLRTLVRGILPPVLVERGLEGAVRALSVSMPVPVDVRFDLPTPLPAPQESALYFAIAEALGNVVKHSQATHAWVQVRRDRTGHGHDHDHGGGGGGGDGGPGGGHDRGQVVVEVGDDGIGGADRERGSGLAGVATRLAAFDGLVGVHSPVGGPTLITLELPCAS
jgi:signal transduction histidine kinase